MKRSDVDTSLMNKFKMHKITVDNLEETLCKIGLILSPTLLLRLLLHKLSWDLGLVTKGRMTAANKAVIQSNKINNR